MAKDDDILPKRYAKAFLDVIEEGQGSSSKISNQLSEFVNLMTGEVSAFFASPVFDRDEKLEMLDAILKKLNVDTSIDRFLQLVVTLGHMNLLGEIAKAFKKEDQERRNEVQAKFTSAFPVSAKDQKRMEAALGKALGKTVLSEVKVDKELLGGVVAEVGGRIFDASIRSYLHRLQEEF